MRSLVAKRPQGFTLIEVMIVLALLLAATVLFITMMRTVSQSRSRENFITIQAREMVLLQSAMKQYVTKNDATFTDNTTVPITVATLITAGFLPTDFALRNGTVGTSPMFQPYLVLGRKDGTTKKVATVVAESSTPLGSRLQQMGMAANDAMVLAFKQQVAEEASKTFKAVSGTVDKNTMVARGVFGSFTKDLTVYLGSAVAAADAVILQGFADLDPGGPGGDLTGKWKSCIFLQTKKGFNGRYVLPSCPAGQTQLAKTPYCNYNAASIVYPSEVGSLYLSNREAQGTTRIIYAWSCTYDGVTCRDPQPFYDDPGWYRADVDVLLNGAIIATDSGDPAQGCMWFQSYQGYQDSIPPYCHQTYNLQNTDTPCVYQSSYNAGERARQDIGQDPYDVLCCLPK